MNKEKKSMDEVLASIRRIIKTDPNAPPPDVSPPPRASGSDETAESVLSKLRESQADEEFRKPLSRSDDPDETARAVLEELRKQAKARPQGTADSAKAAPANPPDLERDLPEPPKVQSDQDYVPSFEEVSAEDAGVLKDDRETDLDAPTTPGEPPPAAAVHTPKAATTMDEDALEAMIRRIVRDELTGEMGKRLTRNVQKLIRHEIGKAGLGKN